MKKALNIILFLGIAFSAKASTSITSPTVSGHWTLAGSPYLVFNDIQVGSSTSLAIDPGVDVIFQGSYLLKVYGVLYASGTATQAINFYVADTTGFSTDTTSAAGGWHGIQFMPYSGTYADSSILKHCNISYTKFDSADYYDFIHTLYVVRNLKVLNCNFFKNKTLPKSNLDLITIKSVSGGSIEIASSNFYENQSSSNLIINDNFFGGATYIHENKIYKNQPGHSVFFSTYSNNLIFELNEIYENTQCDLIGGVSIIYLEGKANIKGNKIHHNVSQYNGAIRCIGGYIDIIENLICNNRHIEGGCYYTDGGGALNLINTVEAGSTFYTVKNNVIANNYSPFIGGAIMITGLNIKINITNNHIINNKSPNAAAIAISDSSSRIVIKNNIFYGNTEDSITGSSPNVRFSSYGSHIEYDHNWSQHSTLYDLNIYGIGYSITGDSATNIVGTDPDLVSPTLTADVTEDALTADFSLLPASLCINRGDTDGIFIDSFDYLGNPRLIGGIIDIGAYESFSWTHTLSVEKTVGSKPISIYPNPATDNLFISTPEAEGTIILMEISGKLVVKEDVTTTVTTIDTHTIPHGIYFVIWNNGTGAKATQKIILE